MIRAVLAFIIVAVLASPALAQQIRLALPMQGHFRAGRYMPVVIHADDAPGRDATVRIEAAGAMPTVVAMRGRSRVVASLLMLSNEPRRLSWSVNGGALSTLETQLTALAGDERLAVVTAGATAPAIAGRFVVVSLAANELRESLIVAWDLPDVVMLPSGADDLLRAALRAGGGEIVIDGGSTRFDLAGPRDAIGGIEVYSPTSAWKPGASKRIRRMVGLSATLAAIALVACATLLRWRGAVIAVAGVVVIAGAIIELSRRSVSPLWIAEGRIVVLADDGSQQDDWRYAACRASADGTMELFGAARPVFVDAAHARSILAELFIDDTSTTLTFHLKAGMKLAVLTRRTTTSSTPGDVTPSPVRFTSPMVELARRMYADADTRVISQSEIEYTDNRLLHWPGVSMRKTAR